MLSANEISGLVGLSIGLGLVIGCAIAGWWASRQLEAIAKKEDALKPAQIPPLELVATAELLEELTGRFEIFICCRGRALEKNIKCDLRFKAPHRPAMDAAVRLIKEQIVEMRRRGYER